MKQLFQLQAGVLFLVPFPLVQQRLGDWQQAAKASLQHGLLAQAHKPL
jgi:hypothetical protein